MDSVRRPGFHIALAGAVSVVLAVGGSFVPVAVAHAATAAGGATLWTARYNGPANSNDSAFAVVLSPDGSRVFVTGYSRNETGGLDSLTAAYDPVSGSELWVSRYNGPAGGDDFTWAAAVSPDGTKVFVAGYSSGVSTGADYATIAYDAATGTQLWESGFNGPGNGDDVVRSVAVSPNGSRVFVTGYSEGTTSGQDYATAAYDAGTGHPLWLRRYNGPGNGNDQAWMVAPSPDGSKVFVTGFSEGTTTGNDYATFAYRAGTGHRVWVRRFNGPGNSEDDAESLAVSPDGSQVIVTGTVYSLGYGQNYGTVAYDAGTGVLRWVSTYNGPANSIDEANAVAISPDGTSVFVTGISAAASSDDYATVAYDATTGTQVWAKRYNGTANGTDWAYDVAVSPDGAKVFVTGFSYGTGGGGFYAFDYATIAYDASTGQGLWVSRYDSAGESNDTAYSLAVSPDGSTVFVTGQSGPNGNWDFATVAYSA